MVREKRILVSTIVAMSLMATALVAPAPETEAGSTDCWQSDVWNTAKLDVSTDPATILAGGKLNGTVGFLRLANLPADTDYTLIAPDGTEIGPRPLKDGEVVFRDVPFCKTGIWDIRREDSGVEFEEFETDTNSSTAEVASILIDKAVDTATEVDYHAGSGTIDDGANCAFKGDLFPTIGTDAKRVRVWMDWTAKNVDETGEGGIFTVAASGEGVYPHLTSIVVPSNGNGTISTPVVWKAGNTYDVAVWTEYLDADVRTNSDFCDEEVTPTAI